MTIHHLAPLGTSFGERVREARLALGVSHEKLAELLRMDKRQIFAWEAGGVLPRRAALEKLADVTGKPIAWFFVQAGAEPPSLNGQGLKTLRERVKVARHALGLSQERLGALVGVEGLQVGRWESGESFPSLAHLERLMVLIQKPAVWFFIESDPEITVTPPEPPPLVRRVADDRPPAVLRHDVFTITGPLLEGLRRQLGDPEWSEEGKATHQGEILARARTRLGINQETMGDQVLGWGKRRLARVEKGETPTAAELAEYLGVLGVQLESATWEAPRWLPGLATEIGEDAEGNPTFEKVRYPTKVDPSQWCSTCELYRLIYPDFRCAQHRGGDWELDEAMRRLERARAHVKKAERYLAQVLKARGVQ